MKKYNIILAIDEKGGIGKDGGIPWKSPEDMKYFKETTQGHAVVMGRKTYESLPPRTRPLPDRLNIVLSHSVGEGEGFITQWNLFDALETAIRQGHEKSFIIGGASVYNEVLKEPRDINEIHLTLVKGDYNCDTRIHVKKLWRATREMDERIVFENKKITIKKFTTRGPHRHDQ